MGVVRTFQHVRLFREMTVIENLLVAQHQQLKTGLFSGLLKTPSFRRAQSEALDRAATWLERIGLLEHANRQASNLSTEGVPPSCPTAICAFCDSMASVTSLAVIWKLLSFAGSSQIRMEYCEP